MGLASRLAQEATNPHGFIQIKRMAPHKNTVCAPFFLSIPTSSIEHFCDKSPPTSRDRPAKDRPARPHQTLCFRVSRSGDFFMAWPSTWMAREKTSKRQSRLTTSKKVGVRPFSN
jgi:hypothetical protein